jgi:hypothetical protein
MPESTVRVYDPPMCCPTGVCGPNVDPDLVRFARDAAWLAHHGVGVQRFNLAQDPGAFVDNAVVLAELKTGGPESLPIVFVGDERVPGVGYPSREDLMRRLGIEDGE